MLIRIPCCLDGPHQLRYPDQHIEQCWWVLRAHRTYMYEAQSFFLQAWIDSNSQSNRWCCLCDRDVREIAVVADAWLTCTNRSGRRHMKVPAFEFEDTSSQDFLGSDSDATGNWTFDLEWTASFSRQCVGEPDWEPNGIY